MTTDTPTPARRAIDAFIRDVAELPDRTSPDDAPDMMLVSADELRDLVAKHFAPPPPAASTDREAYPTFLPEILFREATVDNAPSGLKNDCANSWADGWNACLDEIIPQVAVYQVFAQQMQAALSTPAPQPGGVGLTEEERETIERSQADLDLYHKTTDQRIANRAEERLVTFANVKNLLAIISRLSHPGTEGEGK